jgi:hypothetical protein
VFAQNARIDIRRLAALDMHGGHGTRRRRRIILGEFVAGVIGCAAIGIWLLTLGSIGFTILGIYLLGLAANYVPLTIHVLALWRSEALDAELLGVDIGAQLRYYTRAQFWVFVPFWLAALAILQALRAASTRT